MKRLAPHLEAIHAFRLAWRLVLAFLDRVDDAQEADDRLAEAMGKIANKNVQGLAQRGRLLWRLPCLLVPNSNELDLAVADLIPDLNPYDPPTERKRLKKEELQPLRWDEKQMPQPIELQSYETDKDNKWLPFERNEGEKDIFPIDARLAAMKSFMPPGISGLPASKPGDASVSKKKWSQLSDQGGKDDIDKLDDLIEERIMYPTGTLRVLRYQQTSFMQFWEVQCAWLVKQLPSLKRSVWDERLFPFVTGMKPIARSIRGWKEDDHPKEYALDPKRAVITGDTSLRLTVSEETLSTPGKILRIEGKYRKTLAVVLPNSKKQDSEPAVNEYKIPTSPIRVSLARATEQGDSAGIITEPKIVEGNKHFADREDIKKDIIQGAYNDRPQDNGEIEELVAHWSKLYLLFGKNRVDQELTDLAQGKVKMELPVAKLEDADGMPLGPEIDLQGEIKPGASILRVASPVARDVVVARPGEILLLRGTATTDGKEWDIQGAVEVVAVAWTPPRKADERDAPLVPDSIRPQKACEPEATELLIQVRGRGVPLPIKNAVLHRDFLGFDLPSLVLRQHAPSKLLDAWRELDAKSCDNGWNPRDKPHRMPELLFASDIMENWLGVIRGV